MCVDAYIQIHDQEMKSQLDLHPQVDYHSSEMRQDIFLSLATYSREKLPLFHIDEKKCIAIHCRL